MRPDQVTLQHVIVKHFLACRIRGVVTDTVQLTLVVLGLGLRIGVQTVHPRIGRQLGIHTVVLRRTPVRLIQVVRTTQRILQRKVHRVLG